LKEQHFSFRAAFVVGKMNGLNSEQSLFFASRAASLCIQKKGAMESMPTRQQVEQIAKD
jgi:sugar/nucleoside kinase (ribokinase family)